MEKVCWKLKMWLKEWIEHPFYLLLGSRASFQFGCWLLGLFFLSGITFLQMSHRMMSLSSKRLIQQWRQAMLGHLMWDQKLLRDQFQNGSRKIICLFTRSVVSTLLKYCLNFLETWRCIIILISIISILDCLSTQ